MCTKPTFAVSRLNLSNEMIITFESLLIEEGYCLYTNEDIFGSPNLLVVSYHMNDKSTSDGIEKAADRLRVFNTIMAGRVLCIDPGLPFSDEFFYSQNQNRIFLFGIRKIDEFVSLTKWLKNGVNGEQSSPRISPIAAVKNALADIFGVKTINKLSANEMMPLMKQTIKFACEHFWPMKYNACNDGGEDCQILCQNERSPVFWWEFVHILLYISGKYDSIEHDLNARGRAVFEADDIKTESNNRGLADIMKKRVLLGTANDFISSVLEVF